MERAVIIAANPTMTAAQLAEIGIYKQLRYSWTKFKNFPAPVSRGEYHQVAVVSWLRKNGWNVVVA